MSGYMLNAEKHCGKSTKNPRHHYSPKLCAAGKAIHAIKKKRTLIEVQLPWSTDDEETELRAQIPQLDDQLKTAWIELKKVQAHSRTHRDEFLNQQAKMYSEQHNTSAANAIDIIIRSERQKRMFSKIRRYLKPNPSEPLDRILVPDGQSWREVSDAQEIFSLLSDQAIIEMSGPGTDKTPFTIPPLAQVIPPWSPSQYNDQILNGTYIPPHGCSDEVRDLLKAMMYKDGIAPPELPLLLTTEDLEGAIKSKSESTASSPSGRHIGHYKTALNNDNILQFHLAIINFARQFTCLPSRWCTAIQIRIPKLAGTPYIDKLRMIQLLEFDMNAQFGTTIGRQMIWNAEDNGQFANTPNFGNKPNTQVSSCTLLKKLSYDLMRQMLISGAVCNNDLAKCYDRVHAGIGMITCQRLGVPKKISDLKLKLLDRIKIYTRSAFGLAPTPFGNANAQQTPNTHTPQAPRNSLNNFMMGIGTLYGVLQGSQDAGAIWLSLWAVLYMVLEMITPGLEFSSADFTLRTKRKGEAFVDDTDVWLTETTTTDNKVGTLIIAITALFQRWYRTLRASGGMLGFTKCFFYLIKFKWKNGKPYMAPISETPGELIIETDDERGSVTIQRLEPTVGLRTLGVRIAPDGNEKDELKYRQQQAQSIAKLVYSAPLSRAETKAAHESVWWPSIGFPLGITTFTQPECTKLQSSFQSKFVAKMGYNQTMANAIRYGPIQYGGIALKTIWTEQGLKHLLLALFHLRANDIVGTEMRISISASQLEAGIQEPLLQCDWKTYRKYLTRTWITTTWEFLSKTQLQLRIPNIWTPSPQRQNDSFLMTHASETYNKGTATLKKINRCRLFLKVTTLSDITDATGRYIESNIWKGQRPTHRTTTLNYPLYERPPTPDWTAFRKFLKTLLRDPLDPKSQLQETHKLGPWHTQRHETWYTQYSPTTRRLYIQKPNRSLYSYGKDRASSSTFQNHTRKTESTIPRDVIPISLTHSLNTTGIPTATPIEPQRRNIQTVPTTQSPNNQNDQFNCTNIPDALIEILKALPTWQRQRIENLELCPAFLTQYGDAHKQDKLGSVSDGSASQNGSFAWKIVNTQTETMLAQGGGTCKHYNELTSHRMETEGILGCDIFMAAVHKWKPRQHRSPMPHYCDNQEAVDRANQADRPHLTKFTLHDFDLHNAIKQLRPHRPPYHVSWIKGHQDKNNNIDALPYPARLNIEVDALANSYHQPHPHYLEPPPTTHLYHKGHPITWEYSKFIRFTASQGPLRKRILEKHPEWNDKTFDSISWTAIGRTIKRMPQFRQTRITKLQHNWTPTRKSLAARDNSIDGRCPHCTTRQNETEDHIIRCPNEEISTARAIALVELSSTLSRLETPPDLSHALIYGIEKWIDQEAERLNPSSIEWPPSTYTYDPIAHRPIADAFQMQTEIGWNELLRGRLCKLWGNIIQSHYYSTAAPSHRNRHSWEHQVLDKILGIFDATWTARNALTHGATDEENKIIQESKTNELIRDAYRYDQHNNIAPTDRRLFHTPLATILQKSLAYKTSFLKSINVAKTAWAISQGATNPIDRGPSPPP